MDHPAHASSRWPTRLDAAERVPRRTVASFAGDPEFRHSGFGTWKIGLYIWQRSHRMTAGAIVIPVCRWLNMCRISGRQWRLQRGII